MSPAPEEVTGSIPGVSDLDQLNVVPDTRLDGV